ncbi:hypothetical protein [Marinicella sp. W31]|uniref:hypothetical protein n=1 Tax=Marinicella sp. W31 TaxID=3023713 RepID=UPI003757F017
MLAIITGDVIQSRSLPASIPWILQLKQILSEITASETDWEVFRGDSFQMAVTAPQEALHKALIIKAGMMRMAGVNVRMAIGIGRQDYQGMSIKESNGSAFVRSGNMFNQLKKKTLAIETPWPKIDAEVNLYLELAALTMDNWSQSSATAVYLALKEPEIKQQDMAIRLEITQGNVSSRLKRAALETLQKVELRYRQLIHAKIQS